MSITYRLCLSKLFTAALGALLVASLLGTPRAASAAPINPFSQCAAGTFDQTDMAGRYESQHILLEMTPCGASSVSWLNDYGEHTAIYITGDRLPGGGVIAQGFMPDPTIHAYLDSSPILMVKPAEVGWIEMATITNTNAIRQVYRLQKTR